MSPLPPLPLPLTKRLKEETQAAMMAMVAINNKGRVHDGVR
jgi:hypothetical protein